MNTTIKKSMKMISLLIIAILICLCVSACNNSQKSYSNISTNEAWSTISNLKNADDISQINCNISNTEQYKVLCEKINNIKHYGKFVGFIMLDIKSCKGIYYNIDTPWTSQSTIKAPYVASLLETNNAIWNDWEQDITNIITLSDNESYDKIREYFGNVEFGNFLEGVGVDKKNAVTLYPREITVRDMAKIWTKMYTLLNPKNDETGVMTKFAKLFEHTVYSSTQDVIGRKCKTHCKTGWEEGLDTNENGTLTSTPIPKMIDGNPQNDEIATNDTGIVYAGDNPYILISFTNFAASPSYMYDFAKAIDDLHDAIING